MDKRKENFEEKKFFAKICSGEAPFPPLVKAKNQHKNFEKKPETKKMCNKKLKCSKLLLFYQKKG